MIDLVKVAPVIVGVLWIFLLDPGITKNEVTLGYISSQTGVASATHKNANKACLYQVRWGEDEGSDFAVNLFDARESDLSMRGKGIKIGNIQVTDVRRKAPARLDWWWPIAWMALALVLFEWYIYNKRVYV